MFKICMLINLFFISQSRKYTKMESLLLENNINIYHICVNMYDLKGKSEKYKK